LKKWPQLTCRGQGPPSPGGQIPRAAAPRRQALAAARHSACGAGGYAATCGTGPSDGWITEILGNYRGLLLKKYKINVNYRGLL